MLPAAGFACVLRALPACLLFGASETVPSVAAAPRETLDLDFIDLREFDLDRGGAAEDADHDLEGLAVFIDVVDGTGEVGEGAFVDAALLALFKFDLHGRLVGRGLGAEEDGADFLLGERDRIVAGTEKAGDARGVLDGAPEVVVAFN